MSKKPQSISWKCLVIGYGSIGKRHAQILKNFGHDVFLVTQQNITDYVCYSSIEQAFENQSFDYVIIANATYLHHTTVLSLIKCDFQGVLLVEKPLYSQIENLPANNIAKIIVAYNLRFCELLLEAKKILHQEKLVSFSVYVGQYLPSWRSGNYRDGYSAKKAQGGGVLRDLSHELDYSLWLCGQCLDVVSIGGHYSELEIDSDDVYSILMRCEYCPIVNVQINYLDRVAKRNILIHTKNKTIYIDFIKGILTIDDEVVFQNKEAISQTYINQHKAVMAKEDSHFCSYDEGLNVVKLIEKIEQSNMSNQWMSVR